MPELVVVTFESEDGAKEARRLLNQLPADQRALIDDAMTLSGANAETPVFHEMRRRASWLIRVPRTLFATAFTGAFMVTAWALVAVGMLGGTAIRGVQRIDGRAVKEIEEKLSRSQSALFLVTEGGVPIDLVETLAGPDVDVIHTTISSDNADMLKEYLGPQ